MAVTHAVLTPWSVSAPCLFYLSIIYCIWPSNPSSERVQDTSPSPEVYLSLLQDGHPGGWGLAEKAGDQGPLEVQHLRQREVVWAISVPGESPFVAEVRTPGAANRKSLYSLSGVSEASG